MTKEDILAEVQSWLALAVSIDEVEELRTSVKDVVEDPKDLLNLIARMNTERVNYLSELEDIEATIENLIELDNPTEWERDIQQEYEDELLESYDDWTTVAKVVD